MRKEFGKWLMDVAKYMVTAILLSSTFSEVHEQSFVYAICFIVMICLLLLGLFLVKDSKKSISKKRSKL